MLRRGSMWEHKRLQYSLQSCCADYPASYWIWTQKIESHHVWIQQIILWSLCSKYMCMLITVFSYSSLLHVAFHLFVMRLSSNICGIDSNAKVAIREPHPQNNLISLFTFLHIILHLVCSASNTTFPVVGKHLRHEVHVRTETAEKTLNWYFCSILWCSTPVLFYKNTSIKECGHKGFIKFFKLSQNSCLLYLKKDKYVHILWLETACV